MAWIIIDGYNLLPVVGSKDRESLLQTLTSYKKTSSNKVTIVFDGTHQGTGYGDHYFEGGVEVIFTPLTITADDHIEDMLEEGVSPATIIVSSDRRIQKAADRARISYLSAQDFAKKLLSPKRAARRFIEPEYIRDDSDDDRPKKKKGNPKRLSKKARARKRSLRKI